MAFRDSLFSQDLSSSPAPVRARGQPGSLTCFPHDQRLKPRYNLSTRPRLASQFPGTCRPSLLLAHSQNGPVSDWPMFCQVWTCLAICLSSPGHFWNKDSAFGGRRGLWEMLPISLLLSLPSWDWKFCLRSWNLDFLFGLALVPRIFGSDTSSPSPS